MNNYCDNSILITGVSGFIGSHLAERCIKEKIVVKGLCRKPEDASWLNNIGVNIIRGDLLDAAGLETAFKGCKIVVHTAGWSGSTDVPSELAWRTNVQGTMNVVEAAKKSGVERIIFVSSISVYGLNNSQLIDESMETPLVGELYPDSKIEAEKIIRTSGVPYVIIRPGCIYGPRGKGWTIGVLAQIKNDQFILGHGNGKITPGYIGNFIDGLWLCITKKNALGETFNICDDDVMTYNQFYLAYAKMLNIDYIRRRPNWRIAVGRSRFALFIKKNIGRSEIGLWSYHFYFNPSQYSIDHAKSVLGYAPKTSFTQGMLLTEKWLKNNNYIEK
jgi:nucleoside-diphosphate-sugar epimerase